MEFIANLKNLLFIGITRLKGAQKSGLGIGRKRRMKGNLLQLLAESRAIEEIQLAKLKEQLYGKKIRLLFTNYAMVSGGLEKTIYYILKYMDRDIFEPEVATYYGGKWETVIKQLCPMHKTSDIEGLVNDENFKVVHIFTGQDLYKLSDRAKLIETVGGIGAFFVADRDKRPLNKVIFVSEFIKNFYVNFVLIEDKQIEVIYNPVEFKEVNVERDDKLIGWIGRISPEKNWELFLQVAELLPDYKFVIIGEAWSPELTLQFTKRLAKVKADIEWIRNIPVEDISNEIAKMGLLCFTSYSEGMPMTMLEAMAVKTPVISTPVGGIPEIIKHRKTGFITPYFEAEDYAKDIKEALGSPDITEAAYANVLLKCNVRDYIRKMELIYLKAFLYG
jgi:glycosyltransferase involved in cell wall biosynthesis